MRYHQASFLGLAGILLLSPLGSAPSLALDKPAAVCQAKLGKALYGFKKAKVKAWTTCLDAILLGKACDETARTTAIDTAVATAKSKIEAACDAATLFNPAPVGVGFTQSCQLKSGGLTPAEQMCATLPATTPGELADCLVCWKKAEIDRLLEAAYPCLDSSIPDGSPIFCGTNPSSCPDPLTEKAEVSCLRSIGRATGKVFLKREKLVEKCLNAKRAGKISEDCPTGALLGKIATAVGKGRATIAAACPVMPGFWDFCPVDYTGTCDQPLASVDELRDCLAVSVPLLAADSVVCQQYPDAPADGINCPDTCTPTGDDVCNGLDDDCDGASADGSEDPQVGASCDGSDTDLCIEGNSSCSGGALVCSDMTSSTVEVCNGADDDCDGEPDNGFDRNNNPICGALFNLGLLPGDTSSITLNDSHYNEEWDVFRLTENNDGIVYLSATVTLYSPPGTDFDLFVYCDNCGGALAASSTIGGLDGHYDVVDIRSNDDFGVEDDFNVIVEIRHFNSNICGFWTLQVVGNTSVAAENCGS